MIPNWFHPVAEQLRSRINSATKKVEFVTGIRINAVPHIGTYLALAATFIYASLAAKALEIASHVHIHFLDNDPVVGSSQQKTHFHCVFQKRSPADTKQFLEENYFAYLQQLASITTITCTDETYSSSQLNPAFRSAVIKTLARWKDFECYVSGPPIVDSPSGVRGIGSPCPKCGLFEGSVQPQIHIDGPTSVVLDATCLDHSTYSSVISPANDTFINLETTYRNVIKEVLAVQNCEVLSVMIKGQDWQEGLRNIDSVLEVLGVVRNKIPLRFLVPVVKTKNGTKLSKSAIQKISKDFEDVPAFLLDMSQFRNEFPNFPHLLLELTNRILVTSAFLVRPIHPEDLLIYLER